jgi:hypothetical protein
MPVHDLGEEHPQVSQALQAGDALVIDATRAFDTASSDHILATLALRFVASNHSLAAFSVWSGHLCAERASMW